MISRFEQQGIPNPGSHDAWKYGCTCASLDNHNGKGFAYAGELCFYITLGCPVHAPMEDTAPL